MSCERRELLRGEQGREVRGGSREKGGVPISELHLNPQAHNTHIHIPIHVFIEIASAFPCIEDR